MQILIEIPNPPKKQEIVDIPIHFIGGTVCEAGGYGFMVLPPHGRLIDADEMQDKAYKRYFNNTISSYGMFEVNRAIDNAPTILEEEK